MTRPGRALSSDRKAVSALEIGLILPVLLMFLIGIADFGIATYGRGRMVAAISTAAEYATLTGTTVTAATIKSIIEKTSDSSIGNGGGAGGTGVTAKVTGPSCYCVSGSGDASQLTSSSCTATCGNGLSAGYYIIINATFSYTPLLPSSSFVVPTSYAATAVVQLK